MKKGGMKEFRKETKRRRRGADSFVKRQFTDLAKTKKKINAM